MPSRAAHRPASHVFPGAKMTPSLVGFVAQDVVSDFLESKAGVYVEREISVSHVIVFELSDR
jgi:hypothetical protein